MNNLFLGIDVSTQGAKAVVLDWSDKSIIYKYKIDYDNDLPQYKTINGVITDNKTGSSESDPLMWIDAINLLFANLSSSKEVQINNIKAISVSGQQHGLVALDKYGNLSRSTSKLWNDFSTKKECKILTDFIGGKKNMINEIANTQRTGYTASKILNMSINEKNSYDNTKTFLLVHNYINWYLTGGVSCMEYGDASGTALWDPITKTWSNKLINFISEDLKLKLPNVYSPTNAIGLISKELVAKYNFPNNCMIDAGSGDNMYGAIGTGNTKEGIVTISLGTSGTAYTFMKEPYIDRDGEIACFCDSTGNYLPLVCVSNMANGYTEFLKSNSISHSNFEKLILESPPGNKGNIIIPWFKGERTPDIPNASAIYFGFTPKELNKKNIARGILEGHINNLHYGFSKLPVNPKIIHLTGGLSNSISWCQTISDIFDCETIRVDGEGAAIGAAIHSIWVWLRENKSSIEISEICEPFINYDLSMTCKPRNEFKNVYIKQRRLFKALSNRMRNTGKDENPFEIRGLFLNK